MLLNYKLFILRTKLITNTSIALSCHLCVIPFLLRFKTTLNNEPWVAKEDWFPCTRLSFLRLSAEQKCAHMHPFRKRELMEKKFKLAGSCGIRL